MTGINTKSRLKLFQLIHIIHNGALLLTLLHGLTLILACINNQMSRKVWDKIAYSFRNFNDASILVWESIGNFIPYFCDGCKYLSMLELELIHASKNGHVSHIK